MGYLPLVWILQVLLSLLPNDAKYQIIHARYQIITMLNIKLYMNSPKLPCLLDILNVMNQMWTLLPDAGNSGRDK